MPNSVKDQHALIMAPSGRDAIVAGSLLNELGVKSTVVNDLPELVAKLSDSVLFVVVTEEELRTANLRPLADWVQSQSSWSDLAFILLTRHGGGPERNPAAARMSETLGNVSFIERPFHPTTFASVARTALRGRRRQYQSRSTLEELQESGEWLRTALVAGRLGTWELDIATLDLKTSTACKAIFGREADQSFTYQDLLSTIEPADQPRMRQAVQHTITTGEDYAIDYRTRWPDGTSHWAEVRAHLVRSRTGSRMVGVSLDITARKAAEEQLRTENERLEERVGLRTKELEAAHKNVLEQIAQREAAEAKLLHSQKLEMIGQLTGGVAHDFNNLLMAVLGNLDLLKRHIVNDPKASRLIEGALQGAQRGATLTQRLLAFARRQELSLSSTDMNDLVRDMRPLIERTIGSDIELNFQLCLEPIHAVVDTSQVELALLNLVVNARDAMPDGGRLDISISVELDKEHNRAARLAVRDTGHGMNADTLNRAMEPFFSTKGVGKGTGLGLSMVHGLIEQLGGEFRLTSEVGRGTAAEILLPVADCDQMTTVEETMPEPALPAVEPERLRILLVDDDFLIAMSSSGMLEDLGHEVFEAHSGEEALKIIAANQLIDLMITDFSMPRMNGAQLAISARTLRPDLPILLATGYAELPNDAGIELPRLAKPYDLNQLAIEIKRVMAV